MGAYFWQLAGIAACVAVVWGVVRLCEYTRRLDAEDLARVRALIKRADTQHRQVLSGDQRGVYGIYPPATT
ncbi:hypothetical protein [Mycobacterium sp. E136]|uniref:hypothetical protein n=1 Tax=Mycobacterium sp. E136 TaxID=1834125 RepID=UPI000ADED9C9|nr:hypothetical protein [Mycobacterium sp. E136]